MAQGEVITPERVLRLVRRRPFVPFRIHMSDGAMFEIRHPEFCWVRAREVVVAVPAQRLAGLVDDVHYCSLLHVTRLEELAEAV